MCAAAAPILSGFGDDMNIKQIREQYPEYKDLSDEQLVQGLHRKFYSDMPLDEFASKVGVRKKGAIQQAAEFVPSAAFNAMQRFAQPVYRGMETLTRAMGDERAANYTRDVQAPMRAGGEAAQTVGNVAGDILTGTMAAGMVGGPLMAAGGVVPGVAGRVLGGLGQSVTTVGGKTGLNPTTAAGRIGDMALRSAAGAGAGAAGAALTDPEQIGPAAAIGAAVPVVGAALGAAGRGAANVVKPFSESGRSDIARRVLAESIADPAAAGRIANPPRSVAALTTAEAAMDPGISSLQRAMVNASKDFSDELAIRQAQQNAARFNALYGMSSGANSPQALEAARKAATQPLLDAALQNADEVGTMGVRGAARDIGRSPAYQRRAVRSAVNEAVAPFAMQADDGSKAWARRVPFETAWGARQNIDDISRGASNKVNEQAAKAAGAQLGMLRERLSTALERASPDFKQYSNTYAQMSKPVDAARTLEEMLKQATTGTADMFGNPVMSGAKLTNALKSIDAKDWAKFSPAQRDAVQSLAAELQRAATAQTLAKAVGSNTIQNAIAQQDLPLAIRAGASWIPGGGLLSPILDAALRKPSQQIQGLLGEALLDPAVASRVLAAQPAVPGLLAPRLGEAARRGLPMVPGAMVAPMSPSLLESR